MMNDDDGDHIITAAPSERVNPVAFGRVLGRLDAQDKSIQELKDGQKLVVQKLDKLLEYQAKQKGAASVLVLVSSTIAAIVGWAISFFTKG